MLTDQPTSRSGFRALLSHVDEHPGWTHFSFPPWSRALTISNIHPTGSNSSSSTSSLSSDCARCEAQYQPTK